MGGSLNAEEPPEDQNPLNPVRISLRKVFGERDCAIMVKGQSTLLAWNVQLRKTQIRYIYILSLIFTVYGKYLCVIVNL